MEEKKELSTKEKRTLMIVSLAIVIALVFGVSYAYFMAVGQSDEQTITTANLTMGFTNGDILRATDISPISDNEIKTSATELPFSVTNTSNQHMKITVKLTDITIADDLKDIDFRWGLYNADTNLGVSFGIFKYATTGSEEILLKDVILDQGSATKNYVLRVWIHDDGALQNEMMGETFSGKVTVTGEGVEYTDESCFTFNSSSGTITNYSDTCPKNVVIPKTIGGVTVTKIGGNPDDADMGAFGGKGLTSVIIPNTVTSISADGSGVFSGNSLTHITIPESVTSIGDYTFIGNNIVTVILPESVTSLGSAWLGENRISTIVFPSSVTTATGLTNCPISDIVLMEGVSSLSMIVESDIATISTIEIPSSITSIGQWEFGAAPSLQEIVVRQASEPSGFNTEWNCTSVTFDDTTESASCSQFANVIYRP